MNSTLNRTLPDNPASLLRRMYTALADSYGPQYWWPAQTPLEVIVGAYLTQNTAWRAVEKSIANLKAHNALDLDGLRVLSEADLRVLIRPSGFMQRKAAAIKAFVAFLDREHVGSLTQLAAQETNVIREQLLALPGVGPETADAILLYALGHPVLVVDEYLRRLATRHELVHEKAGYLEIQQLALHAFAEDDTALRVRHYNEFHALVVELGKQHCSRAPRCEGCPLAKPAYNPPASHDIKSSTVRRAAART